MTMEKEMETSKVGRPCRVLGFRVKLRSQGVTGRPFPRRSPLGLFQRDEGIVVMKAEQRQAYVRFSKVQGGSWVGGCGFYRNGRCIFGIYIWDGNAHVVQGFTRVRSCAPSKGGG